MLCLLHFDDGLGVAVPLDALVERLSLPLQWHRVQEEDSFWQILEQNQYQVLLIQAAWVIGREFLEKVKRLQQGCHVVVLFRQEPPASLIAMMSEGIAELIPAGLSDGELGSRLSDFCQRILWGRERGLLPSSVRVVGESMRALQIDLERLIESSVSSVLVTGESGTGKERVASMLQGLLPAHTPFLPLNCAAMPEALLEAEFFGYEKGAFTGAASKRHGLLAKAHRGWLFLDEVACLSPSAQAALLRALETGEVRAIGGYQAKTYEIRVLAATNEDLDALVLQGKFRNDLLQRLRGYEIHLVPFRGRAEREKEEIIDDLLLQLHETNPHRCGKPYTLAFEVRRLILQLAWHHGNIREVWSTLRAMTVAAESPLLTFGCLPTRFLQKLSPTRCGDLDRAALDSLAHFSSVSSLCPDP